VYVYPVSSAVRERASIISFIVGCCFGGGGLRSFEHGGAVALGGAFAVGRCHLMNFFGFRLRDQPLVHSHTFITTSITSSFN
jgi:hypothetical protein